MPYVSDPDAHLSPVQGDQAALVVEGGPNSGAIISLPSGTAVLGRQSDNDIVVDDAGTSRRHAAIHQGDEGYYLADLGSRNGTSVNGRRIDGEYLLMHGDVIRLGGGDVSLVFRHAGGWTADLPVPQSEPEGVSVDAKAREVDVGGKRLDPPLSRKEFDLLMLLHSRRGEAVSKDDMAAHVWSERDEGDVGDHEIEQCVRRVRVRIEPDPSNPRYLVTIRGFGYKLI
ncbi:MAG: FHA domain-containing protein [Chloroflexi bacterium]|nr:FHA domain-containing protein [Chloroflexota bacterium]